MPATETAVELGVHVIYPAGNLGAKYTEKYLIKVEVSPSDKDYSDVLERIFRMMNRVDGSEVEQWLEAHKCRSLSVGDLVRFPSGKTFLCENAGWKEIIQGI